MYNEKILLEMLDIAVSFMNEQEACYYCINSGCPNECSHTDEHCKDSIFEGLMHLAKCNIRKVS